MKNLLLMTLCAGLGFTTMVFSQAAKKAHVAVVNGGSEMIIVRVLRIENSIADTCDNYFCWDVCYTPLVGLTDTLHINPADTNIQFYGAYEVCPNMGTNSITYCFFVSNNQMDSACVTIVYSPNSPADSVYKTITIGTYVGIDDQSVVLHNNILEVYPNPANDQVTIDYTLSLDAKDSKIVLRNLLGAIVMSVDVVGRVGRVIIPVSELHKGIYFYSLMVDGEFGSTKKLLVN